MNCAQMLGNGLVLWIKLQNKQAPISGSDTEQFIVCILEEPEGHKRVFHGLEIQVASNPARWGPLRGGYGRVKLYQYFILFRVITQV